MTIEELLELSRGYYDYSRKFVTEGDSTEFKKDYNGNVWSLFVCDGVVWVTMYTDDISARIYYRKDVECVEIGGDLKDVMVIAKELKDRKIF